MIIMMILGMKFIEKHFNELCQIFILLKKK